MKEFHDKDGKPLESLMGWLCNVFLHTPTSPIMIIGTHGDKVGATIRKQISQKIVFALDKLPCKGQIVKTEDDLCFFPVDNTKGMADPGMQTVLWIVGVDQKTSPLKALSGGPKRGFIPGADLKLYSTDTDVAIGQLTAPPEQDGENLE